MGPRWLGKTRRYQSTSVNKVLSLIQTTDPRWANPIKDRVKEKNQARAVNQVVNALKPAHNDGMDQQLRVVNGMSTATSSILTTAAGENIRISPTECLPGRPGNSTIRWGGGLKSHPEIHEHDEDPFLENQDSEIPVQKKPITPSLATLEKAVSARIYFENLYFPLFRHPPSREQRRLAMEKDMMEMQLTER
jgi:protein-serine/threonine kinase